MWAFLSSVKLWMNANEFLVGVGLGISNNLQGGAKNGATLSHCKYSENFITELRGNW